LVGSLLAANRLASLHSLTGDEAAGRPFEGASVGVA
jgi:hypothetical protein